MRNKWYYVAIFWTSVCVNFGFDPSAIQARPHYKIVFDKIHPDYEPTGTKCGICHSGNDKKTRNDYGKAFEESLGAKNVKDEKAIEAALKKVEDKLPNVRNNDARAGDDLPSKEPHKISFVIAKHVLLHDGKIVSWDEIEKIIESAALKYKKVQPAFLSTNGAPQNPAEVNVIYKRLYDAGHIDGMNVGFLSPRAGERYDRIRNAKDLEVDPASKLVGNVVDAEDKPVLNVEVFLLPIALNGVDVYLQNGRVRQSVEEHLVRTDSAGRFILHSEPGEVFIVACHPEGFFMTTLENFKGETTIKLNRWARMRGRVFLDEDTKQAVNFVCHPIVNVKFHLYETAIAEDGSFDQRFLPPGKVYVQRSVQAGQGTTISFRASEWTLTPGESEEVDVGPIPEDQKKMVEEATKRRKR